MAWTALILSVVAILIAALSAWFALRATRATERQAKAAEAALHDSRTPEIALVVKPSPGTNTNGDLVLTHVKGPDLDSMDIEIVTTREQDLVAGEILAVPVPGFYPGVGIWRTTLDGLQSGQTRPVPVNLNPDPPEKDAIFRLLCRAGDEEWSITGRVTPTWGPPKRPPFGSTRRGGAPGGDAGGGVPAGGQGPDGPDGAGLAGGDR